jgi:hypothetical protein
MTGNHLPQRLRLGIFLTCFAWLMQLSVFVIPIFSDDLSVGHGICAELAIFDQIDQQQAQAHSAAEHAQMTSVADQHAHHTHHHMMDHSALNDYSVNKKSFDSTAPPTKAQHPNCDFCLLLGHTVLPPTLLIAITEQTFVVLADLHRSAIRAISLFSPRYLRPLSHAPPLF